MTKTFDMQLIRYMNLFVKITGVSAKHCFLYNNMVVFVINGNEVERAIGKENSNLKKLSDVIEKRTRVVAQPKGTEDLEKFFSIVVYPTKFEKMEIVKNSETAEKEAIITAGGRENKAMLIGRERAREKEMKEILEQYFAVKNLKII